MRRLPTPLAAACALALCAGAGAAPASAAACAGADDMPTAANAAAIRATTLCMLNKQRRAHHLRKLHGNSELRGGASAYSQLMVRLGFFAHVSPSGSTMQSRIEGTRYLQGARSWSIGENIAWGSGMLNKQRRAHHLRKLHGNSELRGGASAYSQLMVRLGFFDHVSPTGSTMQSRIQGTHYLDGARAWSIGENIAWGSGTLATPRSIVRAWMHSPGHRANILNGSFRDIGIGVAMGAPIPLGSRIAGATYTTDFGTRG